MKSIKFFGRVLASLMVIGSAIACSDLSEIEDRLDVIESDITALQNQLTSVNANFEALEHLKDGGIVINTVEKTDKGYTLTLSNGEVIELELVVEEKAPEKVEVLGNVEVTDTQVKITLADGTVVTVPVVEDFLFAVTFSSVPVAREQVFETGETKVFDVEQKNVASAAIVACPEGFKVKLTDNKLTITAGAAQTKASASSENEIAILAVSTSGHSVMTKFQVKVEAPKLTPNVSLTNVTPQSESLNKLTFTVDFRMEAVAYVAKCVKSSDAAPTAEELMALEAIEKAEGENELTFTNLDPETEYTVYTLAKTAADEWGEVSTTTASTRAVDNNNLYEVYAMGGDIEIAGMKINKTTHGAATLIANDSENKDIATNGVYFVKSDAKDVTINGTANQIVVLSADKNVATIKRTENKSFYVNATEDTNDYMIFSNIKYETVMTSGNVFGGGGNDATQLIEYIIFNKCKIEIPANMKMIYSQKGIQYFTMVDCDVKLNAGTGETNILQTNTTNTFAAAVFRNNIFYSNGARTNFRLISAGNDTITCLEFANNTFGEVYPYANTGYITIKGLGENSVGKNNIFILPNYGTSVVDSNGKLQYSSMVKLSTTADYDNTSKDLKKFNNNYCYYGTAKPEKTLKCAHGHNDSGLEGDPAGTSRMYARTGDDNPVPSPNYVTGVFTQSENYKEFGAQR